MSYKLKPSEEDFKIEILHKDGVQCICPFPTPVVIPYQNALGQVVPNIVRMPCSSQCALFHIKQPSADGTANTHVEVSLHCNSSNETKNMLVELEADTVAPVKQSPFTIH